MGSSERTLQGKQQNLRWRNTSIIFYFHFKIDLDAVDEINEVERMRNESLMAEIA